MDWNDVVNKSPLLLHLGGSRLCHPHPLYQFYVSVDINPPTEGWAVRHDLREPLPLRDNTVDGIHTEDFIEHIEEHEIVRLFEDCYRVLKPGGRMRIGCPDYNNPKDRPFKTAGYDKRFPDHCTLPTRELMESLIQRSSFERYYFYHYWEEGGFIKKPIDYTAGWISRTPDNDPRCSPFRPGDSIGMNYGRIFKMLLRDTINIGLTGFRMSAQHYQCLPGHPWHATSLIVDLFKSNMTSWSSPHSEMDGHAAQRG